MLLCATDSLCDHNVSNLYKIGRRGVHVANVPL